MKLLTTLLLLLASLLVLSSPLPTSCTCSCDSKALVSHLRKYGSLVNAGVHAAAKSLSPFGSQAQSRSYVEYELDRSFHSVSDDEDEDDEDEDDGYDTVTPTTIDCGAHPVTTSELMRLAELQRAGARLPGSMTLALPSAPTGGFIDEDGVRKVKYRCKTPESNFRTEWSYREGPGWWTVWTVVVVVFLMILLVFVAVAIVEIWDVLWARYVMHPLSRAWLS